MKNIKKQFQTNKSTILWILFFIVVKTIIEYLILRGHIQLTLGITFGWIKVRYYSLFMLAGVVVLVSLSEQFKEKSKALKNVDVESLVFFSIIPAIFGARLWHLSTDWYLYTENPIEALYIWRGGLGIYGGVVGALVGIFIYTRKHKVDFLKIVNLSALFLPLAQIIGRYGNLLNQEIYGEPTDLPWGLFIRSENRVPGFEDSEFFHPAYLYEQIGNAIVLLINYIIYRKLGLKGELYIGTWLVGYGLVRFIVEFFRLSEKDTFGLSVNQIVSLGLIIFGTIYLLTRFYSLKKKSQYGQES